MALIDLRHEEYSIELINLPSGFYVSKTLCFSNTNERCTYYLPEKYALPALSFQLNVNGYSLLWYFLQDMRNTNRETTGNNNICACLHPKIYETVMQFIPNYYNIIEAMKPKISYNPCIAPISQILPAPIYCVPVCQNRLIYNSIPTPLQMQNIIGPVIPEVFCDKKKKHIFIL